MLHPDCFDRYFQLALPENELTERELKEVTELLPQQNDLAGALTNLHERDLLPDLLRRWMYRDDILNTAEKAKQAFLALSQAVDHLPYPAPRAPRWPEQFLIHVLIQHRRGGDPVAFLAECAEATDSLFLPVYALFYLWEDMVNPASIHSEVGLGRNITQISADLGDKIRKRMHAAAKSGALITHPRRPELLRCWAAVEGGDARPVTEWMSKHLADLDVLLKFLNGFVQASKEDQEALNVDPVRRAMLEQLAKVNTEDLTASQQQIVEAVGEILRVAEQRDQPETASSEQVLARSTNSAEDVDEADDEE